MPIQKATEAHESIIKTVGKFLSPSLRNFFVQKSNRDFERSKNSKDSDVLKYIDEQNELKKQLERVVGLYNTYRDEDTTL